jgi:hypothetical protein
MQCRLSGADTVQVLVCTRLLFSMAIELECRHELKCTVLWLHDGMSIGIEHQCVHLYR